MLPLVTKRGAVLLTLEVPWTRREGKRKEKQNKKTREKNERNGKERKRVGQK